MYIFETKSKIPENFKIDPQVFDGLPVVSEMFGHNEMRSYTSEVAVRKKGSMDTIIWSAYNRQCMLHPMRGEISPLPVRDPITKKLITGPLIEKTDGGPGILSKEDESIDFREKYAAEGVNIILSLPNGTDCTAKLDQMYSTFKPATKKSTKCVAAMKMVACI